MEIQKYVSLVILTSKKQKKEENSRESQQTINNNAIKEQNGIKIADFVEMDSRWFISYSKSEKITNFEKACELCKKENAILVISRTIRGTRDLELFNALKDQNVNFLICDMPFANPLSLSIIIEMSGYYVNQISRNIRSAMNTKRERGDAMGYHCQNTHPNMKLHVLFKHFPKNVELIKSKKINTMFLILKDYLDEYRQFNSILNFNTLSRPNDITKKEDMLRVKEACNHINEYCKADFELKADDNINPIIFRKEIYRISKIVKTFKKFFGEMTIQEAEKVCNEKNFIISYYKKMYQ